ncbi:DUF7309 domain-containing protein [Sporosalibacterium faouarense]|uniref:DUF7309 domain-containing protein n=1 Tax=Sporosalibacterium faouarense TaxID=516123 RepID=UPI00192CACC2|nr:hypothetical protein [Sporosalibacterium faouarense]
MRKEATLAQWKKLYDVAIEIKKLKPWEYLWDLDIVTLILPDKEEPIYCSIMGRGGECFAIGTYLGFNAIHDFYKMADSKDIPPEQMIRYQDNNVVMCHFGSRDELSKQELSLVKNLDLKFRGKNNWIYFHSFNKGYVPYMLDEDEVIQHTEVLQHLFMALKAYIVNKLPIDFEDGHTLLRRYDPEKEICINHQASILLPKKEYFVPVIQDDILISKLKAQKKNNEDVEIDIAYSNKVIKDKKYDRPVQSRICILADHKRGLVMDQSMLSPEADDIDEMFGIIINYIMQRGKPRTIFIRDEYIMCILKDLCETLGIKLKIRGRLSVIDNFIKMFISFRF